MLNYFAVDAKPSNGADESMLLFTTRSTDRSNTSISVEPATFMAVSEAFNAALLLTGAATSAKYAVIEAISSLDSEAVTPEALLYATIAMSVRHAETYDAESNSPEANCSALPVELRNVLQMEPSLRRCFVLRVLLGMPTEVCAGVLRLNGGQVVANVCAAMQWLANTRGNEQSTAKHSSFESYSRPLSSESQDSI